MIDVAIPFAPYAHEWPGGTNYMRSLLIAAASFAGENFRLHAFVGTQAKAFAIPASVTVHRTRIFDRQSIAWYGDKFVGRLLGHSVRMNGLYRAAGIQVVSHGFPTCDRRLRSIGWIPDFQHLHLPNLFSSAEQATRRRVLGHLARHSDLVVLSSQHALDDYRRFAPADAGKGRVLRFAALAPGPGNGDGKAVLAAYGIERPYFYVPNQVWAHKNHRTLVEAVAIAASARPDILVVCTGDTRDPRAPELFSALQQRVQEAGIQHNVRFLGLIEYSHVAALLRNAMTMINPSLFEGWSTTVEEAKTLGVPALLSDIPTHREQAHPDARYFPPEDSATLAALLIERQTHQPSVGPQREIAARPQGAAATRRFGETFLDIVQQAATL